MADNWTVLLIALTALAAVGAVTVASATGATATQSDTVTIDDNHRLTTQDGLDEYRKSGNATATVEEYQFDITVADTHDQAGVDGVHTDADATYLRVDYDEDIERTFRFYIPTEAWYPHVLEGYSAMNSDVEADMRPIRDNTMTSVTLTLSGETDAVFRVSKAAGTIYKVRDDGRSMIENATGFDIPSVTNSAEWQRIDPSQLSGENATVPIQTNGSEYTLQYDDDASASTSSWLNVPECGSVSGRNAPVCYDNRESANYVWVYSRSKADAPPVRYRRGGGIIPDLRSGINDLMSIPNDILSIFDRGGG